MDEHIVELKCTVCGLKTGELQLPKDTDIDVQSATLADIGIEDIRCDEHRT